MTVSEDVTNVHGARLCYKCNNCGFTEESSEPCVFKISYKAESRSILNLVEDDIIDDPTLSRDENKECEECHQKGCVFFQAHGDGDDAMALIFMCIHCKHKWIG
ncbi:hypothetical protein WA556_002277 [Blastocystis sp. ATCC 50177/Nand II]